MHTESKLNSLYESITTKEARKLDKSGLYRFAVNTLGNSPTNHDMRKIKKDIDSGKITTMDQIMDLEESITTKEARKLDKEKDIIKKHGFMNLRKPFEQLGYKVDFENSPIPHYILRKNGKTFNIANKKYVDGADFVVGNIAFGKE